MGAEPSKDDPPLNSDPTTKTCASSRVLIKLGSPKRKSGRATGSRGPPHEAPEAFRQQ